MQGQEQRFLRRRGFISQNVDEAKAVICQPCELQVLGGCKQDVPSVTPGRRGLTTQHACNELRDIEIVDPVKAQRPEVLAVRSVGRRIV